MTNENLDKSSRDLPKTSSTVFYMQIILNLKAIHSDK